MKDLNSVHFLRSLAEITSDENRETIEKSLIETLQGYRDSKSYRLYLLNVIKNYLQLI